MKEGMMPMTFQADGQDFREQLADGSTGLDWRGWATVGRERPIRLEIAPDECGLGITSPHPCHAHGIVARVYLREPRCANMGHVRSSVACECGPLAEKRLS